MPYDAIIVPGGGLQPDGTLPPWVVPRFDRALAAASAATYIMPLSAGTVHKPPPLDSTGAPVFEAIAGARYLIGRGFPADRIIPEIASWETLGNAYFCRVIHVEPRRFRRLLVITSAFHSARTEAIFRAVFALEPLPVAYELDFEATPDTGVAPDALAARCERERRSLADLLTKVGQWRSLAEFHQWMYTEHRTYAPRLLGTAAAAPAELLKTY